MKLSEGQLKSILADLKPEKHGNNFIISCPKCEHRECGISITKDSHPFGCYRKSKCGIEGNIFTLKEYGINLNLRESKTIDVTQKLEKKHLKVFEQDENSLNLPSIQLPPRYKRIFDSEYLNGRGFTDIDYMFWEVGRTTLGLMKDYVTFPIYHDNEVKAYVARSVSSEIEPKYRNSISEFASLIGGYERISEETHTVILCEGYFDIININRLLDLYDCKQIRPICTFGAKVSDNQIKLLSNTNIKTVIMLFDADVVNKIKEISFRLSMYFSVQIALLPLSVDAGDCNLSQLEKALEEKQSPLDFNLNKLVKKRPLI